MPVLDVERPALLAEEDLDIFSEAVGKFFDEHATVSDTARWRENGIVDRELWTKAGEAVLLGLSVPEEYGGAGGDYRHEVILMEQMAAKAVGGWGYMDEYPISRTYRDSRVQRNYGGSDEVMKVLISRTL